MVSRAESQVPKLLFWLLCHFEQVTEPSEPLLLPLKIEDNTVTFVVLVAQPLELGTTVIFILYHRELAFWNLPGISVGLEPRWSAPKSMPSG